MYLKKTPTPKGRIRLSIVDGYYDKETKNSRQITIESLGYLDDLEKLYDDPIAHFTKRVKQLKKEKKLDKLPLNSPFLIKINFVLAMILGKILVMLFLARFITSLVFIPS